MINDFRGEYQYLSNFWLCNVAFDGIVYTSSESAFQAAKSLDQNTRSKFSNMSPVVSKRAGRKIILRPDWEEVKIEVMTRVVKNKFQKGSFITQSLLETENQELIEGNTWNDTFWGVCNGKGENNLGKILMERRKELNG